MGFYLNSIAPYKNYKMISEDFYFVDKSELLKELFPSIGKGEHCFASQDRAVFKDKSYAEFVYMTGILPIKKYFYTRNHTHG